MHPDEFFYLGKVLKRHGNKGHLLIYMDVDHPEDYLTLESVFVDLRHERIPFFLESVDLQEKGRAIIKLETVDSSDHAEAFTGRELYLPVSRLPLLTGNQFYYHEIKGFRVIDEIRGDLGIVEGVMELPHQSLFQIIFHGKEILIPVVDSVILDVDRKNQILRIHAPEGLIDIYL